MNNSFIFKNIISLSLLFGALSPISYAENFALLGGTEQAKFGASELLNALIAMGGSMPYNEPVPSVYRDDTQKNSIDKAKARAYAIQLIKENNNNCVHDIYNECGELYFNAIWQALEDGDPEIVQLLIDKGASVNTTDICNLSWVWKRVWESKDPKIQAAYQTLKKAQSEYDSILRLHPNMGTVITIDNGKYIIPQLSSYIEKWDQFHIPIILMKERSLKTQAESKAANFVNGESDNLQASLSVGEVVYSTTPGVKQGTIILLSKKDTRSDGSPHGKSPYWLLVMGGDDINGIFGKKEATDINTVGGNTVQKLADDGSVLYIDSQSSCVWNGEEFIKNADELTGKWKELLQIILK